MKDFFRQIRVLSRLSLADILHEWRMSICLVLSVAAIATPLLLFFGLKSGAVETLRHRLLQDPVNLEVIPNLDRRLEADWFEHRQADENVAFVVPHTRKLSAQGELRSQTNNQRVNLVPTALGDPLLAMYGVAAPTADSLVLARSVADSLGLQAGDSVSMVVSREQATVFAEHDFIVSAVLPVQATVLNNVFLTLENLEAVEDYKDGYGVPRFDWPGVSPEAYPAYGAMAVFVDRTLPIEREALLLQNSGFASLNKLTSEQAILWCPWLDADLSVWTVYLLQSAGSLVSMDNLALIREKLRGLDAVFVPLGRNLTVRSGDLDLTLLPAAAWEAELPGLVFARPDWGKGFSEPEGKAEPLILLNPADLEQLLTTFGEIPLTVHASGNGQEQSLDYPFLPEAEPLVPQGYAMVAQSLLGRLNLLEQRPLLMGTGGELLLAKRGYSGFRMYAPTLEQVEPLAKSLEQEGIHVDTRGDRIAMVLQLNRYLGLLFWIIALAALAGGLACLLSNIYASVERKRRELSVLRLLGVHGASLITFPLFEALFLTLAGLVISLAFFHAVSLFINGVAAQLLLPGETLCRLSGAHHAQALLIGTAIAVLATLLVSRRMLSIDPAESLRDE